MEAMRQTWTDDRLDDLGIGALRQYMADEFACLRKEMREESLAVRKEMKEGFEGLQRMLIQGLIGAVTFFGVCFSAVVGLIAATQF